MCKTFNEICADFSKLKLLKYLQHIWHNKWKNGHSIKGIRPNSIWNICCTCINNSSCAKHEKGWFSDVEPKVMSIYHLDRHVMTNKCKSKPNRNNPEQLRFQDNTHNRILIRAHIKSTDHFTKRTIFIGSDQVWVDTYLYNFFICDIGFVHLFFDHFAVAVRIQCGYMEKWLKTVKISLAYGVDISFDVFFHICFKTWYPNWLNWFG